MELKNKIEEAFHYVLSLSNSGMECELSEATVLLESGLDSLGFAVLVSHLESILGYDPFTLNKSPFYPRTFGEFTEFYRKYFPAGDSA